MVPFWNYLNKGLQQTVCNPVADPGFPLGGHAAVRGRGPLTWVLFGENVCENERIGSHMGWYAPGTPPRSAIVITHFSMYLLRGIDIFPKGH